MDGWRERRDIRIDTLRLVSHEEMIGCLSTWRKRTDLVRRQWSISTDCVGDEILLVLGEILRDNIGDGLKWHDVRLPLLLFPINIYRTPTKSPQQAGCIEIASKEGNIGNLCANTRVSSGEAGQRNTTAKCDDPATTMCHAREMTQHLKGLHGCIAILCGNHIIFERGCKHIHNNESGTSHLFREVYELGIVPIIAHTGNDQDTAPCSSNKRCRRYRLINIQIYRSRR